MVVDVVGGSVGGSLDVVDSVVVVVVAASSVVVIIAAASVVVDVVLLAVVKGFLNILTVFLPRPF